LRIKAKKTGQTRIALEDLDEIKKQYTKPVVEDMLKKGKEVVKWIKAQL